MKILFKKYREVRTTAVWVSIYDKFENLLKTPKPKFVKDLTDSHLINIVKHFKKRGLKVPSIIKKEILFRKIFRKNKIRE